MTYNLSEISFDYDFFSISLPDGNTLILNKVDEDFIQNEEETVIDGVNIVVATESENIKCSSVIGVGNDYFTLTSDYEEYLGTTLTSENMKYCYLEIPENE